MATFRDPKFMLSATGVAILIERFARDKKAFCLVRLGDGEGNLLNSAPSLNAEDREYFASHFGNDASAETIIEIKQNLVATIDAADLIGMRDDVWLAPESMGPLEEDDPQFLARFRAEFPLREVERDIDYYGAKRLFRLFKWKLTQPVSGAVCSSWVCYDLALLGFWERLIVECGSIGIIHCSPSLPAKIRAKLGVDVESILVPDKALGKAQWECETATPSDHYRDVFTKVCERLSRPLDGKIFLVGAGLAGKRYLKVIKDNGGLGIDVGALLDAWDGRATRKLVYQQKLRGWYPSDLAPAAFQLGEKRTGY